MKVGLQKKSQPSQNRNKVWVKSTSSTVEHETISSRKQQFSRKPIPKVNNRDYAPRQQEDRPPVKCYGCRTPGFIRAKSPVSTVYLRVSGIFGKAYADTGSSHYITGETLYTLLKDEDAKFRNGTMCISLADGQRSTEDVLITTVTLEIEGRKFDQELIALPNAKKTELCLELTF
ncbi:hypothetical protein AVEN_77981-1 [Araneus ventricosus]|uniref:Peptidase A2 domain-containing protein n=1 Tax=Araneus ventricosus TaxID=182803 RepID=A0A4Y2MH34_ARAVE|nr:hypothetical protein AVEN_77981-1 [Araneus ventricosus]